MTAIPEHETVQDLQREDRIADLLMDGKSVHEVAEELGLSADEIIRVADERHIFDDAQTDGAAEAAMDEEPEQKHEDKQQDNKPAGPKYHEAVNSVVNFLARNPGSYSRMRLKAIISRECPGTKAPGRVITALVAGGHIKQDPQKNYRSYVLAFPGRFARDATSSTVGASSPLSGQQASSASGRPRTVTCPDKACGKVMEARSQGTKIKALFWNHLFHGIHNDLPDAQRKKLMKLAFPDYRPMATEKTETPAVNAGQPGIRSASAMICPGCEKEVTALLARAGIKFRSEVAEYRITTEGVGR